ncbi:MAG: SAM-dependent methyltransferase [Myxococcales bacterium]|nr:MAG: SAM-dependent methyltransferase [Myxococcales bacterium]
MIDAAAPEPSRAAEGQASVPPPPGGSPIQELARTALWVAAMRALETEREKPLFRDPFARLLAGSDFVEELRLHYQGDRAMPPAIEVRTRWLDDQVALALGRGIRQVVILAAGMDARAYRLAWPSDARLFELDHAEVLREKEVKLAGVVPKCDRRTVSVDLDADWPTALREAGLRTDAPILWLAEGLLVYLPEELVRRIVRQVDGISVSGSILLMDVVGRSLLVSARSRQLHELANQFGTDDPEDLLRLVGWAGHVHTTAMTGQQLGRWPYPVHPRGTPGVPQSYLVHGLKP